MVGDKQVSYEDCACVGGCENCEQLDYAAIVGDAKRFERERIIKLLNEQHDKKRAEFAHPYSKPMFPEQWSYLEALEDFENILEGEDK